MNLLLKIATKKNKKSKKKMLDLIEYSSLIIRIKDNSLGDLF